MSYIAVACPNCGANIAVTHRQKRFICNYCNSVIISLDSSFEIIEPNLSAQKEARKAIVQPKHNHLKKAEVKSKTNQYKKTNSDTNKTNPDKSNKKKMRNKSSLESKRHIKEIDTLISTLISLKNSGVGEIRLHYEKMKNILENSKDRGFSDSVDIFLCFALMISSVCLFSGLINLNLRFIITSLVFVCLSGIPLTISLYVLNQQRNKLRLLEHIPSDIFKWNNTVNRVISKSCKKREDLLDPHHNDKSSSELQKDIEQLEAIIESIKSLNPKDNISITEVKTYVPRPSFNVVPNTMYNEQIEKLLLKFQSSNKSSFRNYKIKFYFKYGYFESTAKNVPYLTGLPVYNCGGFVCFHPKWNDIQPNSNILYTGNHHYSDEELCLIKVCNSKSQADLLLAQLKIIFEDKIYIEDIYNKHY